MIYHLGRIIDRCFGFESYACCHNGSTFEDAQRGNVFQYDHMMPSISISDACSIAGGDDVLISFDPPASWLLGWTFPGMKICYVQSLLQQHVIDQRFDVYVSVSRAVSYYLSAVYNLDSPIISPFINSVDEIAQAPWADRPEYVFMPFRNGTRKQKSTWEASCAAFTNRIASRIPQLQYDPRLSSGVVYSQKFMLMLISRVRYALFLSEMEGFGLTPLEAMALGTIPLGYDGYGGRDYMEAGHNCVTVPYPNILKAADLAADLIGNQDIGMVMSENGRNTASKFSYKKFESAWIELFSGLFGVNPVERLHLPFFCTRSLSTGSPAAD